MPSYGHSWPCPWVGSQQRHLVLVVQWLERLHRGGEDPVGITWDSRMLRPPQGRLTPACRWNESGGDITCQRGSMWLSASPVYRRWVVIAVKLWDFGPKLLSLAVTERVSHHDFGTPGLDWVMSIYFHVQLPSRDQRGFPTCSSSFDKMLIQ